MDLLHNLGIGFGVAFTLTNLAYAFLGCLLGTLVGVLPGLGPVATIAMLLPTTYALDATPALIMLAGIYYGSQYGGSTTAILINVPGESASVVTAIDGYQMARQGRAGAALAAAGLGSFFAGCVGTIVIAAFAPPLTELAFKFGPAEYFSLMVLGLIGAVVLASGSLIKAIAMIILGLLLAQINTDVISGTARYSFDIPQLTDGIGFVDHRHGRLRLRRDHRQPRPAGRAPRGLHQGGQGPLADQAGLPRCLALGAARHRPRLDPGRAARRRRAAVGVRRLHDGEEDRRRQRPLRQGRHPRRRRARERQQRRRADLVHPHAHARHPAQRGDGADGRRDDDQGHPARPAGDDQQPAAVLGADRLDVGRQR